MIRLTATHCPAHAPISCFVEEHLGKGPGTSCLLQKRHSRSSLLAASFLKGSREAGRKRDEGRIPCCNGSSSPLPHHTFSAGSSAPSQHLSKRAPIACLLVLNTMPPGKVCWSLKTKPFSKGLLKSKSHENERAESQKFQVQTASMELLRFQPPAHSKATHGGVLSQQNSPPTHTTSALSSFSQWHWTYVRVHSPAGGSRSLLDMGCPGHITCRTSACRRLRGNLAMKSAAPNQSPILGAPFLLCRHPFQSIAATGRKPSQKSFKRLPLKMVKP